MVPEVDKKDTEILLRNVRETLEATRQEILDWSLSRELTKDNSEAQAVRKLASRAAQQARQFVGRMLSELGTVNPYPNSIDPSNQKIDATTVKADNNYKGMEDVPVIQRIKFVRQHLNSVDKQLEALLHECTPGTRFNMFLFEVQLNSIQAMMWLGELLHECVEPQEAPVKTVAPQLTGFAAAEAHDLLALADLGKRVVVNNYIPGQSLTGSVTKDADKAAPGNYYIQLDQPTVHGVDQISLTPTAVDAIKEYQIVAQPIPSEVSAPIDTPEGAEAMAVVAPDSVDEVVAEDAPVAETETKGSKKSKKDVPK